MAKDEESRPMWRRILSSEEYKDRYHDVFKVLKEFCFARVESIRKQLNGSLASSSSDQNPADRSDVSKIKLLDMNPE